MNTVNITLTKFEELVEIKAKMDALAAYLDTEEGKYPSIEAIRAIIGERND